MRRSVQFQAFLFTSVALGASTAFAAFPDCPNDSAAADQVTAWRDGAVSSLTSGDENSSEMPKKITACFPTEVPQCLKRVFNYSSSDDTASASKDLTIDNAPQKQPPKEFLSPNGGFKYVAPSDVEAIAKANGWPAVRYKSRHAGGFDPSTPSLLMVYVPGNKVNPPVTYDRWLNFALTADTTDVMNPTPAGRLPSQQEFEDELTSGVSYPRTFTMVSLEKATETQKGQVFFQLFRRKSSGSGNYYPAPNARAGDCYNCHPNGLRTISPMGFHVRAGEKQMPEADWNTVKLMNDAMDEGANGKVVSWREAEAFGGVKKPLLRPESYWPFMGPSKPNNAVSRTQAFIMGGTLPDGTEAPGCFQRRKTVDVSDIFGRPPGKNNIYTLTSTTSPKINWQNVKNAMRCETCHNNKIRGAINTATDLAQVDFKILVDQSMPLGTHQNPLDQGGVNEPVVDGLTGDERIALANCLQAEMEVESPLLSKYLAGESCGAAAANPPAAVTPAANPPAAVTPAANPPAGATPPTDPVQPPATDPNVVPAENNNPT